MYKCTNETCNKIIDMLLVPLKVIVITGVCRKLIQIQLYYVDHTFNIFNVSLLENLNCLSMLNF